MHDRLNDRLKERLNDRLSDRLQPEIGTARRRFCVALAAGTLAGCGGAGGSGGVDAAADTGPALKAAFNLPVGVQVGEPLVLDGSASAIPAGLAAAGALQLQWTATAPDGSALALNDAGTLQPWFVPLQAGSYRVSLRLGVQSNGASASAPVAEQAFDVAAAVAADLATVRSRVRALAATAVDLLPPDATSPLLVVGAPGAPSQIAGSRLLPWSRPEFRSSGRLQATGTVYPDTLFGSNRSVSYAADVRSSNYVDIEFDTDASSFEIFHKGTGFASRLRVAIDGRLAATQALGLPADGGLYLTLVQLPRGAAPGPLRRVRLLMQNPAFGGIRIAASDRVLRPATGTRLRALFFGDSITEGTANETAACSYAVRSAQLLGWRDAWVSGVGATGYLAAPAPKLTLRQRFGTDVRAYAPDVLVLAAGVNDAGLTDTAIAAEAQALFDLIQAELPDTLVFVCGPWGTPARVRSGVNAAIKMAVGSRRNFVFVPNVDEGWLNAGNAGLYIGSDATHPTAAGIEMMAARLAGFIRASVAA